MSPDERARRGLTPPDPLGSDAAALEREALAPTNAAPLVPANGGEALPLEESSRYELEGVHARGGLGRVVRAHDRLLRRTVAIKELLQRTPSAQARFMREALITARLQHPGIVPVHEAGRWASGDPYYSMKLVSGRTLKELIQARKAPDERLALLPHVLAVAEAIAYAHSQDVIHRDIKPANVVVGDFGETVVVDWGLAKDLAGGSSEPNRDGDEVAEPHDSGTGPAATAVGHIMGTPSYMAPEQARGDTIDARADVYSLGAMLYELLAGEPPHTGDSADKILLSALAASPVPIELRQPGAPPDLVAIVHKAMARRPEDRYPSAIELAEDVRRFQTGQLVTARRYSTRTLIRRWIGRHRGVVAMAAVAAVALAVTGAVAFQRVVAQRNLAQDRRAAAQKAEQTALERQNELIFLQAQSWLTRDPTAALAWLKLYPSHGNLAEPVGAMVDEALDLGVARHVLRLTTWPTLVAFTGDGGLIGLVKSGEVTRYDVETGAGRLLGAQGENVRSAAMSPDGKLLAVGGLSGSIQLFSADGAHPPRRLPNQSDMVYGLIFSADGGRLLTLSAEREVRLWDVARGEPVLLLDREPFTSAELSGDGETVFLALPSGAIDRITVATGARRKVAELDRRAYSLALSPDGKLLAAEWGEWTLGSMALIDLKTGEIEQLDMPAGKGTWGFSPNGRYLASASNDGTVHVHELASETDTVLRGHEDALYHMVFSEDESKLLTASDDATARLWDLKTGSVNVLRGHEDDVFTAALSADGKTAVTASFDASIRLWQLDSSEEVSQVVGHMGKLLPGSKSVLTEDGGILLAQTGDDEGLYWNLETNERLRRSLERDGLLEAKNRHLHPAVVDRGGRLFVFPRPDGVVSLWNFNNGEQTELRGQEGQVITALAVARAGGTVAAGNDAGQVVAWNLKGGDAEPRVLASGRVSRGAALSPDGQRLAIALQDRLELLDVASGAVVATAELDPARTLAAQHRFLDFSPNGKLLVARDKASSALLLWNLSTRQLDRIELGGHGVQWLAFSPDSSQLALAVEDRTVRVVDTATRQIRLLGMHRDLVHMVAWSHDGKMLASGSYDRTIRLWDPDTGRVRVLRGHSKSVDSIAFTPDGLTLISASADETVRKWFIKRLPDNRAEAVNKRLVTATTAVIGVAERAEKRTAARPATPAPDR